MKRTNAGTLVCCLVALLATCGRADEPEISLLAKKGWARIRIVLGRLEVANIGSSQTRTAKLGEPDDDVQETLTITSETTIPTVRYQKLSGDETLSFAIANGQQVELVRTTVGVERAELRFEQSPQRDLLLEVGRMEKKETYRAPSLWHLMLEEPVVCQRELLPVLQWLQPQWRLTEFMHRTEDELIVAAARCDFETARTARQLVARLDCADYRRRQAALRDLRSLGIGLLPYLHQLDPADLSREQRQRISRLETELRANTDDTPQRMANWLVEDERTWLTLLEHREPAVRKIAVAHLGKRFPRAFAAGLPVDPETKLRQIAKLKAKYQIR